MKSFFIPLFSATISIVLSLFCLPMTGTAQVLFTQDFSTSTTVSTYIGSGANQFDFIGVNGSGGSSVYATGNRLNLQRNTNNLAFARTTDFSPTPDVLKIKFKFSVPFSSNTTATATAALFYVGSGFTSDAVSDANAARHSSLLVGFAATSGTFNLRTSAFVTSGNYTGEQIISWYINNSGATINYIDPTGGATSLANDAADVWVGTTRIFNALAAVTASQTLTDFKFLFSSAQANSAVAIDDIEISTGSDVVLPVSLANFNAKKAGAINQLTWATESEANNKGFEIQRQTLTGIWEPIGFVNGSGKATTYTFEDKHPLSISYYRLRQLDFDGKEILSKVVSVSQEVKGHVSITPNPTSEKINIQLGQTEALRADATLVLFDMTGRQVLSQRTSAEIVQLDLSNLTKGMYILTVQSNNAIYQEKIIRQ